MLDMIADYKSGKREDRRSAATVPQQTADLAPPIRRIHSISAEQTKSIMSKCVVGTTASEAETTLTTSIKKLPHRRKLQVKQFNETITCTLCHGYLISPTCIDICGHSFCRSCIVKHLDTQNNCPQCKPPARSVTVNNLRSDDLLRTLVFKLVPGLFHKEREKQLQFSKTIDSTPDCDILALEEDFFSPVEPISLSLEYHPSLLVSCNKSQIPPVRYLQCFAGLTIHHLKRFLCFKYDIDPENQRVDIDIIYEDEILPDEFSLMDVGYCYKWKRVAPMRFFYSILVVQSPEVLATTPTDVKVPKCENNHKDLSSKEARRMKKSIDSEAMMAPTVPLKTVRFLEPSKRMEKNGENNRQVTYSVFKSKSLDAQDCSSYLNNNNNNNNDHEHEKHEGNGTMKMIIARKQSPKRSNSEESVYNITNDFKSLRSNDMRYSDYTVTSTTSGSGGSSKRSKVDVKPVTECDIVVSIPQSQIHRSPNSSDESSENLSLAELKTAGKKITSSSSSSSNSVAKKNIPKLKIELNSLKTKITIPKPKSAEPRQEPRKISKRKLSIDEPPVSEKVDLKTYAKNIGLKPKDIEKSVDLLEPSRPKSSPDASPMSTSSSNGSSTSNGTFSFTTNDGCPTSSSSSHKKRKKKHSKEPKDSNGKRRKLHAEISSQPADESLKMKVKITGSHNHRPHKVENRKSSSSSDDVALATPTTTQLPPPSVAVPQAPVAITVNGNDQRISPKPAPSPPTQTTETTAQIPSAANFSVPKLNHARNDESSSTKNLITSREAEVAKKSSEAKPKLNPPQIMTTIHTTIPSNSHVSSTSAIKTPLPKPLATIQDMKLPASPPLPPSLFKTTPLTIPTLTTTSTKPTTQSKPPRPALNPPTLSLGQSNRPPKLAPATPKSQFAVPQPPPKSVPNSPKPCPIPSIASSAHKQAAQLKRSASLDGPHPASHLNKQQKLDHDSMMRKSAYGPMFPRHQSRPPKSSSINMSSRTADKPYYSSSMSASYTHEINKRKPMPLTMPPSSISVTKMNDKAAGKVTHSSPASAVTITSQQKHNTGQHKPYHHQNNQKPALEIMRVPTSSSSSDHKSPPSAPKSSPPKATRPPPPPIPLVKIKKSQSQSMPLRSPALTVSTKSSSGHSQASPPGLISMRSIIPAIVASKSAATIAENAPKQPEKPSSEMNGKHSPREKHISKDRRPSCKDGSVEILDLSGKHSVPNSTPSLQQTPTTSISPGNSLEAALNKIKQNMTTNTVPENMVASNKPPKVETPPEDLQNLHMLSESATSREKIVIKTLPKLNEISKVRSTQAPVRQQNASVRNIPNPSALAFRNQSAIPMLNSISSTPPPPSPPAISSAVSASPSAVAQPEFKVPTPPSSSPSSSTNPDSPPRLKKNLNIEQVAANLNMRAAAAADKQESSSSVAVTTAASPSNAVVTTASVVSSQGDSVASETVKESPPSSTTAITSSNVVSSSSSSSLSSPSSTSGIGSTVTDSGGGGVATTTNRESSSGVVAPITQKTSVFKSISTLVAPSSSTSSSSSSSSSSSASSGTAVSAGTA